MVITEQVLEELFCIVSVPRHACQICPLYNSLPLLPSIVHIHVGAILYIYGVSGNAA